MIFSILKKKWLHYLFHKPKMISYYGHWLNSLKPGHSPLEDQFPWIVYEAVAWLKSYLRQDMRVFEWGSGGSTLFIAKRVKSVISVEHDSGWYGQVDKKIHEAGFDNIQYELIVPKKSEQFDTFYASSDERFWGYSFSDYAQAIDFHTINSFDLVVVDGRARLGCIKHAISRVRPGGYLLLDNSERIEYALGKQLLIEWHQTVFRGPGPYVDFFTETTVWQKPSV
jgi:hypothetical protein